MKPSTRRLIVLPLLVLALLLGSTFFFDIHRKDEVHFVAIYRKEAFHGNGETFSVDLSPGSEVSFWRVLYRYPDLFGSHFNRVRLTPEPSHDD